MIDFGLFTIVDFELWLIAGLVLCALETQAPGAFLIWIGLAALIVGGFEYVHPTSLTTQMLGFAALTAVLVLIGRRIYGSLDARTPQLPLSRAHALIGREFFLDAPIARGFGVIRVGDSVWRVAGDDCPMGAKVRVTAVEDGALLKVEKA